MESQRSGLVDIARDFLTAHQQLRRLFARYRRGDLAFEPVRDLVGDTEESPLFRLKERCHSLFRPTEGDLEAGMGRDALFDLTIGSLFHEAMVFRENFYQRTAYGPKVRALRSAVGPETEDLFREFERILEAASVRLDEALQETEALLLHARAQFRQLLQDHTQDGLMARCLIASRTLVEEVFQEQFDSFLDSVFGEASEAYLLAGRSFLASGYFKEAGDQLRASLERRADSPRVRHLAHFADGMQAFLEGSYEVAVQEVDTWLEEPPLPHELPLLELAHSAFSRMEQLVPSDSAGDVIEAAGALARQLDTLRGEIVGEKA